VVNHSVIARAAGGTRSLPSSYPDLLDQVVALGDRNGARRPVYVFARIGRSGRFVQLEDGPRPEGRVGFMDWNNRQLARDVAVMLNGVPGWRDLGVVPTWPNWLRDRAAVQLDERILAPSPPELNQKELATLVVADVLDFLGAVARQGDRNAGHREAVKT
jgi:hypothetical protein